MCDQCLTLTYNDLQRPVSQGFNDIMVKTKKTKKAPKPGGLASLPRVRPNEDDLEAWPVPAPHPRPPVPARPRVGGRALQDPEDLRSERYGMRLHPDLRSEMTRLARMQGWKMAQWIEKSLIDAVNKENGRDVLDKIGRYLPPPPLKHTR
jgi:hypothetical protein